MTRSFGDTIAHSVGCITEPETFMFKTHREDKIIVLASDGIWEFLSNEDVASIVYPYFFENNPEGATQQLIAKAHEKWSE